MLQEILQHPNHGSHLAFTPTFTPTFAATSGFELLGYRHG